MLLTPLREMGLMTDGFDNGVRGSKKFFKREKPYA